MLETDERYTPLTLFNPLNEIFDFTLDVAATAENAKCSKFYTKETDGLSQSWAGERVFCNPPYSRGQIEKWLTKAAESNAELALFILPCFLETRWAQLIWQCASMIYFPKGRVKFAGMKSGAKFGTIFVYFGAKPEIYMMRLFSAFGGQGFVISQSGLIAG